MANLARNKNFRRNSTKRQAYEAILKQIEIIRACLDSARRSINKKPLSSESVFFSSLDGFIGQLDQKVSCLPSNKEKNKVKGIFREAIREYLLESPLFEWGYTKPKGYAGDYQMLEWMYDNRPASPPASLGALLDKYFLQVAYVKAVRDRKDRMRKFLRGVIENCTNSKMKILNLACGSSREIRELLSPQFSTNKEIEFVLVDQEADALKFSREQLGSWAKIRFHFVRGHVLFCLQSAQFQGRFGEFDFIYSIGLADYLPDRVLGYMIKYAFDRLKDGGQFFISHKNVRRYSSPISDWMCDWNFVPRDKGEVLKLVKQYLHEGKYAVDFKYTKDRLMFDVVVRKIRQREHDG